jgi:hypothetical protein
MRKIIKSNPLNIFASLVFIFYPIFKVHGELPTGCIKVIGIGNLCGSNLIFAEAGYAIMFLMGIVGAIIEAKNLIRERQTSR